MCQRLSGDVGDRRHRVPGALVLVVLAMTAAMAGCRRPAPPPEGRYIVTSTPLAVGSGGLGLCIAVDPRDPHGVWWWQPGASGCATRSTGPNVFPAEGPIVSRSSESEVLTVAFRLPLISRAPPSFLDVRLVVEDGRMRTLDSRAAVAVHRRRDLNVPADPPGPR